MSRSPWGPFSEDSGLFEDMDASMEAALKNLCHDESELLRELEALSGEVIMHSSRKELDTLQVSMSEDVEVDMEHELSVHELSGQVILQTDDVEAHPELLAELEALCLGDGSAKRDLHAKGNGDYTRHTSSKPANGAKTSPKTAAGSSHMAPLTAAGPSLKSSIPNSKSVPALKSPQQPRDATLYRTIIGRFQKQTTICGAACEYYAGVGRKTDAMLYAKRRQAFELDLQRLRALLKAKQDPPPTRLVNVVYDHSMTNSQTPEGELHVSLSGLKVMNARRCPLKMDGEYQVRLTYELPGLGEREAILLSPPFTPAGLQQNVLGPLVFRCNRRDVRVVKGVEHKKLRLEIVCLEGFLFFKTLAVKAAGYIKLEGLLRDCTVKGTVDLTEVDGEGRRTASSMSVMLEARTRVPLGVESVKRVAEQWLVIPHFGNSNHVLYSDLAPPLRHQSPPPSHPATGTFVDHIRSFEVIEFELAQLASDQTRGPGREEDESSSLATLSAALEAFRDRLQMQVELGELTMDEYIATIRQCINDTKQLALKAKRAGDTKLAHKYVRHVDIMRREVADVEADTAGGE